MIDIKKLETFRERLASATGEPKDDASRKDALKVGVDLKAALGFAAIEGDPTQDVRAALELCELAGALWEHVATPNDIQYVHYPANVGASGFMVTSSAVADGTAVAICRGLVTELWLAHPARV